MTSSIDKVFMVSVQEAVQKSLKNNQALFVFLSRDDEISRTFAKDLLQTKVGDNGQSMSEKVQKEFVGLMLIEDTTEYGYFKQIFHDLVVPSFYVVDKGQLLDVITQECTPDQFVEQISKILNRLGQVGADSPVVSEQTGAHTNAGSHEPIVVLGRQDEHISVRQNQMRGNTLGRDHDQNVARHKRQTEMLKREEHEERKKIRALLEADKRERHLRQMTASRKTANEASEEDRMHKSNTSKYDMCSLSIKLFDGNSLRHDFKASQTLNDVRSWLDNATDHLIIPNANASLPSFATASYPQPTHYVFHHPVLPRITYSDDEEFKKLSDLDLCPRSVLILKPIYDDKSYVNAYPNGRAPAGYLRSVGGAIGKFGNAIYSFFDYSVGDPAHDYEIHDDMERSRSPLGDSEELNGNRPVDITSINDSHLASPASERVEDYFDARLRSGAGTPNVLSINSGSQPSLINFGSNPSPVPFSCVPSMPQSEIPSAGNGSSNYNPRSSTPKPISSIPSVSNIQTVHEGSSKSYSKHESKVNSDEKRKDRNTYNGNSINLGDDQDD